MMTFGDVLSILIIIGEGCIVWALLRFRKTFGAYTDIVRQSVEATDLVHRVTLQMLKDAKTTTKDKSEGAA